MSEVYEVNMDDVRKLKKEADAKEAARQTGGFRYWTPKHGDSLVRVLPPWTNEGPNKFRFHRQVYLHWNVGSGDKKSVFTCPKMTPDVATECPICDYVDRLRATGDPADKEAANDIAAKANYYSNIIDCKDPVFTQQEWDEAAAARGEDDVPFEVGDTKVQLFRYGPQIFLQIVGLMDTLGVDGVGEDVTRLDTGRNLTITRKGKGKNHTKYNVVHQDRSGFDAVGNLNMYNLDKVSKPKTLPEMQQAVALPGAPPPPQGEPRAALPPQPSTSLPQPSGQAAPQASAEEIPECFKDANFFSQTDEECVGNDDGSLPPCPYFQECGTALGILSAEPEPEKPRRRRKSAPVDEAADLMEKQMLAEINKN